MKPNLFLLSFLLVIMSVAVKGQSITNVDPDSAVQCQKLTIAVTGQNTNFHQGTSFLKLSQDGFDIDATGNTVISSTQIESEFYFNPDQPTGSYDVNVNNGAWGDVILEDGFWLDPPANFPQLISIEPDTAFLGDTIWMDITGSHTHFDVNGLSNNIVLVGNGSYLNDFSLTVIDSLHLKVGIQIYFNNSIGSYTLYVSNQLDGEMTLPNALVVLQGQNNPEIVSVEPSSAHQGEDLTLTVTGSNTSFKQGTSVLFLIKNHGISCSNQIVLNDSVITGDFIFNHDHDTGFYDVVVMDWQLGDLSLINGFQLLSYGSVPDLLSVSPDSACQGTRVSLVINAENTEFDKEGNTASITLEREGEELFPRNVNVIDSVTLEADFVFSFSNLTGYRKLIVETPFDGTMTLDNCFRIIRAEPNASIVSVVPDSAYRESALTVSVTGKGVIFMQGTSNLNLSQGSLTVFPSNETIVNDTVISGEFNFLNTFPIGKYDVNVDNGSAWPSMSLPEGFTLKLFDFIDETGSTALLTVYPNPTNGLLTIGRNFNATGTFQLMVYDARGNLLLTDHIENVMPEKMIDLTSFPKGVYFLKITQDQKEQTERFVVQ